MAHRRRYAPDMERGLWGWVLVLAIGLAPAVLVPMTWTLHGPVQWMVVVRSYPVPVLAVETMAIVAALATGLVETLRRVRLPRPALVAAALLAMVMVGTVPFAPVPPVAATFTAIWVIHIFFGLSVAHLAGRIFAPLDLVRGYGIGFALFCGLLFVFLVQVRDPNFNWTFDLPAFSHVRIFGHYAAPVAGLAAGLMALGRTRGQWAAAFALATLALALVLWTGSRGALIGVAAGVGAGLLFAPPVRHLRAWGGIAAALAVAWLSVASLPAPAPTMGSARIVAATVKSGDRTTGRTQLWAHVAKAAAKRPIFGHGEGQMYSVARFADLFHPHNIILQFLLAWGIVGLACAGTLAFYFARESIRLVRAGADELVPPFIAMVALAVPSLVDGSLFHLVPLSIFAACAGLIGSRMLRQPARA